MGAPRMRVLRVLASGLSAGTGLCAVLAILSSLPGTGSPRTAAALPDRGFDAAVLQDHRAINPSEMTFTGDTVICDGDILDPTVASWCEGMLMGTIILGVDPASPHPEDWDGAVATAELDFDGTMWPKVAVITVEWPDVGGKGIHSPLEGRVATIAWDGVLVWAKRTRDVGMYGDYYAAKHYDVVATAVITEPSSHTLAFEVPAKTAWDIASISIDLYPMPDILQGIAYSPFRDCQNPHWGPFPSVAEVEEDIARLAHMTNGIRTYSSLNVNEEIPRMAREHGLQVCAGAWLAREKDHEGRPLPNKNREEIDGLIAIANSTPVDCVIVGNEVLLRGDLTEAELVAYIEEVKRRVPTGVDVTTAEIGGILRSYPNVIDAIDLIMFHIYPYWDYMPIDGAVDYVVQAYQGWKRDYPDKRIIIGETGWPSDGPTRGLARPSLENQKLFFHEFLAAAQEHDIEFYYFDAFDELWKREGGVGSHWGYMYADRTGKHEVQSVLVPENHLGAKRRDFLHKVYLPSVGQHIVTPELPESAFIVFDEYVGEENHFAPSGWMGDWNDLGFYECDRTDPYRGQVSARITYAATGPKGWAGIYWQEPDGNWAAIEGAGYDLDDASYLRLFARGEKGGEKVRFFMGGIWGEFPDSQQPALSTDVITLTTEWHPYYIDLRGRDLSRVIGGFGFVTDRCLNPGPITFHLDAIHYVMGGDPGAPPPTPTPDGPYTFDVYRDRDVAGNHYEPSGWMGDTGDIVLNECWRDDTHSGSTAIRVEYTGEGAGPARGCSGSTPCNWAGVYWQHPAFNWGDRPGGYDLRGAKALRFWAKAETDDVTVSFKVGGVGCDTAGYPDSLCPLRALNPSPIRLTNEWQVYIIPLCSDDDLSSVVGGFVWAASKADNPNGATFLLDDIQFLFNQDLDLGDSPFEPCPIPFGTGNDLTFDGAGDGLEDLGRVWGQNVILGQARRVPFGWPAAR